jgi:hypothetical protein
MILEDLAPGARRRTRAAGTTEASLLGLLDGEIHGRRILKQGEEVNTTFRREGGPGSYENGTLPRASSLVSLAQEKFTRCEILRHGAGSNRR